MNRIILTTVVFLAAAIGARAQATFQLSGTISSVSGTTQFAVGQPFTIAVTYTPSTPDEQPGPTQIGTYSGAVTSYVFNYNNGAYFGTGSDGRLWIYDGFELGTDESQVDLLGSTNFPAVDGQTFNTSGSGPYFFLVNNSGTLFASDALPASFPTSGWNSGYFNLGWGESFDGFQPEISVSGTITAVSAIPEPATWGVLAASAAGAVAVVLRSRRRDRGQSARDLPKDFTA